MVFQAFFTTFLVEPGYEKPFETFDELINSDIHYGAIEMLELTAFSIGFNEFRKLKYREECASKVDECMSRTMFKGDMIALNSINFANFFALSKGVHDVRKVVCFLPVYRAAFQITIGVQRGDPIVHLLNKHIRMCTENGFVERFWSDLEHTFQLQAEHNYSEDEMYFVFTLDHLIPAFQILLLGYVLSSVVLVLELFF